MVRGQGGKWQLRGNLRLGFSPDVLSHDLFSMISDLRTEIHNKRCILKKLIRGWHFQFRGAPP